MSGDTLMTIVATILTIGLFVYIGRRIGTIAERRGRHFYTWAVLGSLQPLPTIILVYILPNKAPRDFSAVVRQF